MSKKDDPFSILDALHACMHEMVQGNNQEKAKEIIRKMDQRSINLYWCYVNKTPAWDKDHTPDEIIEMIF